MTSWSADDLFQWWIVQQQSAVMVHLGKIVHPATGKVERDLETAKFLIDLLAVMETKTKGNLSGDEERLLSTVLTNLRLNFVQEANRPDPPVAGATDEKAPERPDRPDQGSSTGGAGPDAASEGPETADAGPDSASDGPSGEREQAPGDAGARP